MEFQEDDDKTSSEDAPNDSEELYALWISRDPEEPGEGGRKFGSLTLSSTMFCESSELLSSLPAVDCEKSFGQEIILKSTKLDQVSDTKDNLDGKISLVTEKDKYQEECKGLEPQLKNSESNSNFRKAPDCHPIAKFWKNQIEQAKALDTSNLQCQVEGTYEESYQTLDVS